MSRRRSKRRGSPPKRSRRGSLLPLQLLVLVAVTFAVYWGTLSADFTYDDAPVVLNDPAVARWDVADLTQGWGRHVRLLTLRADRSWFGTQPVGYHAHSLVWHAICVLGVFGLARGLFRRSPPAFVAALLFAVHPVHVEAVANVANRKESLCLAFSLLALWCYTRALGTRSRERSAWLAATAVAGALAMLSKEVALALAPTFIVYEFAFVRDSERFLARPWVLALGALVGFAVLAGGVWWKREYIDFQASPTLSGFSGEPSWGAFALTSARAFWLYLRAMLWPTDLCPDQTVALSQTLLDPATLLAWLGFVAWIAAGLWLLRRSSVMAFALLWVVIHFLPVSNWIPLTFVRADRYAYIPSLGVCLAAAAAIAFVHQRATRWGPAAARALAVGLTVVVAGAYAAKTRDYVRAWQNDFSLWAYTAECNPLSFRAHNGLGNLYHLADSPERALGHYEKANALRPDDPNLLYNRANTLFALGRYGDALRDYNASLTANPERAEPWYNRANTLAKLGRHAEAIADYGRAIEHKPDWASPYVNRGTEYEAVGRPDLAERDYARAAEVDPEYAKAWYNLGRMQNSRGDRGAARRSLTRAAQLGLEEAYRALDKLER